MRKMSFLQLFKLLDIAVSSLTMGNSLLTFITFYNKNECEGMSILHINVNSINMCM